VQEQNLIERQPKVPFPRLGVLSSVLLLLKVLKQDNMIYDYADYFIY